MLGVEYRLAGMMSDLKSDLYDTLSGNNFPNQYALGGAPHSKRQKTSILGGEGRLKKTDYFIAGLQLTT